MAFAGLALAFADGLRLPTRREVLGDVLQLGGGRPVGGDHPHHQGARAGRSAPHRTLFYQLAGSAVLLGALAVASGEPGVTRLTGLVVAAVSYQIVIRAFASYLAWFWLLTRYPASHLHAYTFWTPLFGRAGRLAPAGRSGDPGARAGDGVRGAGDLPRQPAARPPRGEDGAGAG